MVTPLGVETSSNYKKRLDLYNVRSENLMPLPLLRIYIAHAHNLTEYRLSN